MLILMNRLKSWTQSISKPVKVAFITAILIGLIAHLSFMTNHFVNLDSIEYITRDPNATYLLTQGKWLFELIDPLVFGKVFSAGITVPVATIILALTAAVTTSVLKIQHSTWAFFIACFLVLFPSVFCTYSFYAATYFFALFLSATAVYVTDRWKRGWMFGIAILTTALGIYAVYIGYAAGLFVILSILRCLDKKDSLKDVFAKGWRYLAVLFISIVLYFFILKWMLAIRGAELSNYRGMGNLGTIDLANLPKLLYDAYLKVWYFFRHGIYMEYGNSRLSFGWLNTVSTILCVLLSLVYILRSRSYQKPFRMLTCLALAGLLPLAIHAIAVLGQNQYTHWLMIAPFVLVYILMVTVADRLGWGGKTATADEKNGVKKAFLFKRLQAVGIGILASAVFLTSAFLSQQWFILTNTAYEKLRMSYENAYASGIILANDVLKTEEYTSNTPVAFIGDDTPEIFQKSLDYFGDLSYYMGLQELIHDTDRTEALMYDFIGIPFVFADDAAISELSDSEETKDMPIYPAAGAIKMIDGILVVKLSSVGTD